MLPIALKSDCMVRAKKFHFAITIAYKKILKVLTKTWTFFLMQSYQAMILLQVMAENVLY